MKSEVTVLHPGMDNEDCCNPGLAALLELRLRARGNPKARRIIDRCLVLCAQNPPADATELKQVMEAVRAIADELALTYGAPRTRALH